MKELKFRKLLADEIEVRVQSVKNGKATMLLYMNSRVVTDLLDETVGAYNWTSEYYEVNGKLVCRIGIWDEDKKIFVYKSDTGSESNIEAEKGQFSDCYKRCLSRWGVNELYTAPNIIIDDDGYGNRGYYVSLIRYDEQARKIIELHIANKFDKEVFSWKYGEKPAVKSEKVVNSLEYSETPKQSNMDKLTAFCSGLKNNPSTDMDELKRFYNYYSAKADKWDGVFNVEKLYVQWCERNK